jgi:hypothetical protein
LNSRHWLILLKLRSRSFICLRHISLLRPKFTQPLADTAGLIFFAISVIFVSFAEPTFRWLPVCRMPPLLMAFIRFGHFTFIFSADITFLHFHYFSSAD